MDEKMRNYKELQKELETSTINDLVQNEVWEHLSDFESKLLKKWVKLFQELNVKNKKNDDIIFPFMPEKLRIALHRVSVKLQADALKQQKQEFTGGQGGNNERI